MYLATCCLLHFYFIFSWTYGINLFSLFSQKFILNYNNWYLIDCHCTNKLELKIKQFYRWVSRVFSLFVLNFVRIFKKYLKYERIFWRFKDVYNAWNVGIWRILSVIGTSKWRLPVNRFVCNCGSENFLPRI